MKPDLSKLKARIWDYGLFTSVAQALGPLNNGFGTVELYTPWTDPFPCPDKRYIGRDLEGITRIWEFWEDIDSVDTFIFPDVGDASEQQFLRSLGKPVFGSGGRHPERNIAEMEVDRELLKKTLLRRGLAVPRWEILVGIDNLREYCKKNTDFWIKPNVGERGVFETYHFTSYKESEHWLDRVGHDLGVARDVCQFMIEKPVGKVEPGSDFFVSNGVAFETGLYGWENKGDSYTCRVLKMNEMPSAIRKVNDAMAPVWKTYQVDGALSTEIRIGANKIPNFTDLCSRFGNPPAGCITSLYKNFPQIVRGIAHGEAVVPEFNGMYGAEIAVDSTECACEPTPFEFKGEDWYTIKLRTACKVKGQHYHIPFAKNGCTIVKAVGVGKTQEEAEGRCLEAAEKFQCPHKTYNKYSFDELRESIKEGEKYGLGGTL